MTSVTLNYPPVITTARRLLLLLLLVVSVSTWVGAGTGYADGQSASVYGVVDRVEPRLGGVEIRVENGPFTLIAVENTTDTYLDVLADSGEPFLRVGPRGVFANLNSPQWYLSNSPEASAAVPPSAREESRPRWGRVSSAPKWAWFDERLNPQEGEHAAAIADAHEVTKLADWSVLLRYGGSKVKVDGHLEYRPLLGTTESRLTSSNEVMPGVTVNLLPGSVPGVFLENTTNQTVLVRGRQGEPFARVGPDGTQVNTRSATYADDQRARGLEPPAPVDASKPPSWVTVSDTPRFTWLESRAVYTAGRPAEEMSEDSSPVTLGTWDIPLEIDGSGYRIEGVTVWTPSKRHADATESAGSQSPAEAADEPSSPSGIGVGVGVAALSGLALGAIWGIRRRRRTSTRTD